MRACEEREPRTTVSVAGSGLAGLISRVPRSITVAAEDHRGTQACAKQTKQVEGEERTIRLHGYGGARTKINVFSLLFVSCRSQMRGGVSFEFGTLSSLNYDYITSLEFHTTDGQ